MIDQAKEEPRGSLTPPPMTPPSSVPTTEQPSHEEKVAWMALWAAKNKLQLMLEGEVGFGRQCVGVVTEGHYPDYEWYDNATYERIDPNGDVWTPPDAYHKHPCVAVLGRGEAAEAQLYDWLKWFDDNNFKLTTGDNPVDPKDHQQTQLIKALLGQHRFARMEKQQ